ncbi:hypothetical protein [Promineifilum sp.]|uniref:hypothetical protein n=1 Tax=Promineifilum sp. TaxID=2664178 RepID=UPI0035B49A2E
MLATYRAVLKGNRLEWTEETPQLPSEQEAVSVYVTFVPEAEETLEDRRQRVADALYELSMSGAFAEIDDPITWQREIRQDRPLPGRDE